jgi:hypothetical protein
MKIFPLPGRPDRGAAVAHGQPPQAHGQPRLEDQPGTPTPRTAHHGPHWRASHEPVSVPETPGPRSSATTSQSPPWSTTSSTAPRSLTGASQDRFHILPPLGDRSFRRPPLPQDDPTTGTQSARAVRQRRADGPPSVKIKRTHLPPRVPRPVLIRGLAGAFGAVTGYDEQPFRPARGGGRSVTPGRPSYAQPPVMASPFPVRLSALDGFKLVRRIPVGWWWSAPVAEHLEDLADVVDVVAACAGGEDRRWRHVVGRAGRERVPGVAVRPNGMPCWRALWRSVVGALPGPAGDVLQGLGRELRSAVRRTGQKACGH